MGREYEPEDSRNVTGTSTNQTGDRWSDTAQAGQTPDAAGQPQQFEASHQRAGDGETGTGQFADQIREHMEVIGADGTHVGTVDHIDGDRIKLTKSDSGAQIEGATGAHEGHHHYISQGLIATIEGDQVRLSANADVAVTFEEEEAGS